MKNVRQAFILRGVVMQIVLNKVIEKNVWWMASVLRNFDRDKLLRAELSIANLWLLYNMIWLCGKYNESVGTADMAVSRKLFHGHRTVCGPFSKGTQPVWYLEFQDPK